jgi:hypothetical protein
MQKALKQLDAWHQTKPGLVFFGVLELMLAYAVGSTALGTGSWAQYAITLLLLVGGLHNFIKLIGKLLRVEPKASKARRA